VVFVFHDALFSRLDDMNAKSGPGCGFLNELRRCACGYVFVEY